MVALETEFLLTRQETKEHEVVGDVETYVLIFNKRREIFLSGNERTGLDTIHGFVNQGTSVGEWIIDELRDKGLSERDLKGLSVFPETHRTEFQGRKVEIVGILCDSEAGRKLVDGRRGLPAFIGTDLLINWNYRHLTPNGLGELVDKLSVDGVIDRPEIFVPEVIK